MTSFHRRVVVFVPWLFSCGITIPGGLPVGTDDPPVLIAGTGAVGAAGRGPIAGVGGTAGRGPVAGISGAAGRGPIAGVGGTAGRGPVAGVGGTAGRGPIAGVGGTAGRGPIAGAAGGWAWPVAGVGGTAGTGPVYLDRDGDGFNEFNDCNDLNPGVHPGAIDECCDKQDTDCDGKDSPAGAACRCATPPPNFDRDGDGWSGLDGDCNDQDASFFPGNLAEACCDGLDNDCDGRDDPRNGTCECASDWDGDGWIVGPWGDRMSDCDDRNVHVNPAALEICDDGIDNDCDGRIDDARCAPNDVDGDGFPTLLDCNDFDRGVYPGAPEWCGNGVDDDCDGLDDKRDPNCMDLSDHDGDGYPISNDCNDWDGSVYPGNAEYCGDGVDNNCDGVVDPSEICGERDWDRDGFPAGKDCNDGNTDVFPGSPYERCCDGVDSNCDGMDSPVGSDCGCDVLGDADGDGYGVGFSEPGLADCNDQDASVHPGAPEICGDGRDNDCDGRSDSADNNCWMTIE